MEDYIKSLKRTIKELIESNQIIANERDLLRKEVEVYRSVLRGEDE